MLGRRVRVKLLSNLCQLRIVVHVILLRREAGEFGGGSVQRRVLGTVRLSETQRERDRQTERESNKKMTSKYGILAVCWQ